MEEVHPEVIRLEDLLEDPREDPRVEDRLVSAWSPPYGSGGRSPYGDLSRSTFPPGNRLPYMLPQGPPPPPMNNPPNPPGHPPTEAEWQINNKFNLNHIPSWEGRGESIIDYISEMSSYAILGDKMNIGIGKIAPLKWTGSARAGWDAIPILDRRFYGQNWDSLLVALQWYYMNDTWTQQRDQEFQEMKFQQKDHYNEQPVEFLQRRIRYHSFLHPTETDGPTAIARVLRTQPPEWGVTLNPHTSPTFFELLNTARNNQAILESSG